MIPAILIPALLPPILAVADLPAACAALCRAAQARYRASRMYQTDADADRAAFEQARAGYWSELKKAK